MEYYCVLDANSLRFSLNRRQRTLTVWTELDELLAVVPVGADVSEERAQTEAAFTGMDTALERTYLVRPELGNARQRLRVALYNPHTAQIAVGAVGSVTSAPQLTVFTAGTPLVLPASGVIAEVDHELALMRVCGQVLTPHDCSRADLGRSYVKHQEQTA